jgi:hypothetical protein
LKKLNLAKVRLWAGSGAGSVIGAHFRTALLASLAAALLAPSAAPAAEAPRVVVAVLPNGVKPEELGTARGLAPGLMSAGLARVPAEQTYLDIGQGNRIFSSFYDGELPFLLPFGEGPVDDWDRAVARADSAPAEIVPGLLASTLRRAGIGVRADARLLTPALIAADRHGVIERTAFCGASERCPPGVTVEAAYIEQLPALIRRLRGRDLLIAVERAPPERRHHLSIGIAGEGFGGDLVSGSTRLRGVVLATDLAPTILRRFGVAVPDEMLGRSIHSDDDADAAGLGRLDVRLARVVPRRQLVIGANLTLWLLAAGIASLLWGARVARVALPLLAVTTIYMPGLLLLGAALGPTPGVERLIVGLGAPALAALTLRLLPGYGAFALACAASVGAYAADMLAGSALTPLSLMGPNPVLGVRFYGIGNELEATLTVFTILGAGAALAAWPGGGPGRRAQAACFLAVAAIATVVFAAGRFGADVGAAIVLPAGAAVAALYALGLRGRRLVALAVAAPIAGLASLIALDLALGGDSHLSRSVLHAGDSGDIGDVAYRRLHSSARSFTRPVNSSFLLLAIGGLLGAFAFRRRVARWFAGRPAALAGLAGALAATLVGTLANDSGALVLIIGTAYLAAYAAFAWSQGSSGSDP